VSDSSAKQGQAGPYDPLAGDKRYAAFQPKTLGRQNGKKNGEPKESVLHDPYQLLDVRALLDYVDVPGEMLCGDAVLEVGELEMLFGFPSVGKSWAILDLMVKAAWGRGQWLGHEIKCQFATLWIGDENNKRRLSNQLKAMHAAGMLPDDFEQWIHITDVPETMDVDDRAFMAQTRRIIEERHIRLVVLDTVSSAVVDETAKDFAMLFRGIKGINYGLPVRPCWLLVHHRRKPKSEDTDGMGRLHAISGHQVLRRKPRSIIELERVTEKGGDRRVIATLLKNANGKSEGEKHALQQTDTGFTEIEGFDFAEMEGKGAGGHNEKITEQHMRELFDEGRRFYHLKDAVAALMKIAGCKDKAAYAALKLDGRFAYLLIRNGKEIGMKCATDDDQESED
jgi:hypothetical protein